MSDKCPLCNSTTTDEVDPNSSARKVTCKTCGYENIESATNTGSQRVDYSHMSDSDLLRKIEQDTIAIRSRIDKIFVVGILIVGYWIFEWIVAFLAVGKS